MKTGQHAWETITAGGHVRLQPLPCEFLVASQVEEQQCDPEPALPVQASVPLYKNPTMAEPKHFVNVYPGGSSEWQEGLWNFSMHDDIVAVG